MRLLGHPAQGWRLVYATQTSWPMLPMLETGHAIAYTGQTLRVAGSLAGNLH